jgi:putative cell wall-binding protein
MRAARTSGISRAVLFVTLTLLALGASCLTASPAAGLYLDDEAIPGKPLTRDGRDALGPSRMNVAHRVFLLSGQRAQFILHGDAGTDFDLYLYGPSAESFTGHIASSNDVGTSSEYIDYTVSPGHGGWYYLRVARITGSGDYRIDWGVSDTAILPTTPERLWGADRYACAVDIAEDMFPGWHNVEHVILASGEDRAAADPLSASGLAWAYGAPILLVQEGATPACVIEALQEIRAENGPFHLHIVGGPMSVTRDALVDIESNVTGVIWDRLEPYDDRYTLAATIARRMAAERPDDQYRAWYGRNEALVANGEDPDKFFDALALSPVCGYTGRPILLVRGDSVPAATDDVIDDLGIEGITVGGGPATVSEDVVRELNQPGRRVSRISGADRYETARAISTHYSTFAWPPPMDKTTVGLASQLPDALTGGAFLGLRRGCFLLTQPSHLPEPSRSFLENYSGTIRRPFVFGGPASVDVDAYNQIRDASEP